MQKNQLSVSKIIFILSFIAPCLTYAESVLFEMDVLPSLEGAVFEGNQTEASAFSVTNGVLRQDTTNLSSTATAFYRVYDIYDNSEDGSLFWHARLEPPYGSSTNVAAQITIRSLDNIVFNFAMANGEIRVFTSSGWQTLIAVDTTQWHRYEVKIPANTQHFDFYIDGQWVIHGEGIIDAGPAHILFGDSTTGIGGNAAVSWRKVRLNNWVYFNLSNM